MIVIEIEGIVEPARVARDLEGARIGVAVNGANVLVMCAPTADRAAQVDRLERVLEHWRLDGCVHRARIRADGDEALKAA